METLEFTADLVTGAGQVDRQHETLVNLVNTLIRSLEGDGAGTSTDVVLAELSKYIFLHFRSEEEFMEQHGFMGLEEHRVIHRQFEGQVAQWEEAYAQGQHDLMAEILEYLGEWLVHHIMGADRAMVHEVLHGSD